jgi:triosephosphate isomerase
VGRKPLIAGNWKMNLTHLEAIALMQKFAFALPEKYYDKVEVAVLPPFTHIRSIQTMIDGDGLLMVHGAQDLSPHDAGAYTGDVSGVMLAKLGCRYVVVGHSERREYHDETDEVVNAKVRAAIRNGITPILCVGEGLPVREEGAHVGHCTSQLTAALAKVTAEQAADLVVAYEPVWAIGTGRTATSMQAQEAHAFIRGRVGSKDRGVAGRLPILYGGSVKASNAAELFAMPDVDGGLVGGASLVAEEFVAIWRAAGATVGKGA